MIGVSENEVYLECMVIFIMEYDYQPSTLHGDLDA